MNQKLMKQYFLSSRTAIWANVETFISAYISVYNRIPMDSIVLDRNYLKTISWQI